MVVLINICKYLGSFSKKAQCSLAGTNGDLLVHNAINKRDTDSQLRCYGLLSIYLSNSASSNQCFTVSLQLEGYKRVSLSQTQVTWGEALDFTKLSEQDERELPEAAWCKALDYTLAEELIGQKCVLSLVCSWFNSFINLHLLACILCSHKEPKWKGLWKLCTMGLIYEILND